MTMRIEIFEENLLKKKQEEALANLTDPYKGLQFPYLTVYDEHYS